MIGIKTRLLILNRNFLKKRFGFWSGQTYKLHLSAITHENVKEDAKISPEERMRMKQKRKEARRLEYLENQKQNQLKKKVSPIWENKLVYITHKAKIHFKLFSIKGIV